MIKWNALEGGVLIGLKMGWNRISVPGVSETVRGFSHAPRISENSKNAYWLNLRSHSRRPNCVLYS